nr:bacterial transcriptional activator domain-containing protein [Streptomonospora sp. PA3]
MGDRRDDVASAQVGRDRGRGVGLIAPGSGRCVGAPDCGAAAGRPSAARTSERTAEQHQRPVHLSTALEAYTGPPLGEADRPIIEPERENRRRLASSVCVEAAHLSEDTPAALEWLERARDLDEHNEAIYQELMRAHARNDRPDEVTRVYERLRESLHKFLEIQEPEQRNGTSYGGQCARRGLKV